MILVWHHLDKKNRAANHDEVSEENCLPDFNVVSKYTDSEAQRNHNQLCDKEVKGETILNVVL